MPDSSRLELRRLRQTGTQERDGQQGCTFQGTCLLFVGSRPQQTVLPNQWLLGELAKCATVTVTGTLHTWLPSSTRSWTFCAGRGSPLVPTTVQADVQESRDRMTHIKHFAAHLDRAFVSQAFMQELNNYV